MASIKELNELKAEIRASAAKQASVLEDEFASKGLGFISPPPELETKTTTFGEKYRGRRGGEWDFYLGLSKAEKGRIRRNWTSPGGMQPDQFGIDGSITGQFDSPDKAVEKFLDLTRRIDVLKRYANTGKLPKNMEAYGGLDLDSIFEGVLGEIEFNMRVPISISRLYGEDSLGYLSGLQADSAAAYGEKLVDDAVLPPKTQAEIKAEISSESAKPTPLSRAEQKLKTIKKAQKTAVADAKRKTNLSVGTVVNTPKTFVPVGDTVEDKLASIQALKNAAQTPITMTDADMRLEAAKARGRAMSPISDLIEYGDDDLISSGSFDDQIDYADDAYSGMINSKPIAVEPRSSARATSTAVTTTSRSSTTKNIIKGVETATDMVSSKSKINLKTAFAASTLGLAGGYMFNRNRTRR